MKVLSLLLRNLSALMESIPFARSLNESPELIAQELDKTLHLRLGAAASMKVLSLLLRNLSTRGISSMGRTSLNESPELIAQEFRHHGGCHQSF